MVELIGVPARNGTAPYRSRFTSQTVLVKNEKPVFWMAGIAGVMMLSRIQRRVATAAMEATQVITRKRSFLRRVFFIIQFRGYLPSLMRTAVSLADTIERSSRLPDISRLLPAE